MRFLLRFMMLGICCLLIAIPISTILVIIPTNQAVQSPQFSSQETTGHLPIVEYTVEFLAPQNNTDVWSHQYKEEHLHLTIGVTYNESFTPTPTQVDLVHQWHNKIITMLPQEPQEGFQNSTTQLVTRYYNTRYPWIDLNVGKNLFIIRIYFPSSDTPFTVIWSFYYYETFTEYVWDRFGLSLTIFAGITGSFSVLVLGGVITQRVWNLRKIAWGLLIFTSGVIIWGMIANYFLTLFIGGFISLLRGFIFLIRELEKRKSEQKKKIRPLVPGVSARRKPRHVLSEETREAFGVKWRVLFGSNRIMSEKVYAFADGSYCPNCDYELDEDYELEDDGERRRYFWKCVPCNKIYSNPVRSSFKAKEIVEKLAEADRRKERL